MKIRNTRTSGFTLVEIMIVVAIIGLLAAIAIPNFVRARTTSQMNACINNPRQLDGAVQQYALENKLPSTAPWVTADLIPYIKQKSGGGLPDCPAQGTYDAAGTVAVSPACSLSTLAGSNHKLP